jgi:hypothetical protein
MHATNTTPTQKGSTGKDPIHLRPKLCLGGKDKKPTQLMKCVWFIKDNTSRKGRRMSAALVESNQQNPDVKKS